MTPLPLARMLNPSLRLARSRLRDAARTTAYAAALALTASLPAAAADPAQPLDWATVEATARGQTVYWHAWGGSGQTNDFIAWVGRTLAASHGITLEHVKLADTADAIARVTAEQAAGLDAGGAVDLIWINGSNFAALKQAGLLFGPFAAQLPNWQFADVAGKRLDQDFTLPTDGFESPWAMAQVVFMYDADVLPAPPKSAAALLDWARANPGRFSYPLPPDFLGTTFLKQMLIDLTPDANVLTAPAGDNFAQATAPLWAWLDALHPALWRKGRSFPRSGPHQLQLLDDGEVDLAISFSPGEASAAIANGQLPESVRTYVLEGGTLGNASFVAIPYNASAKDAALVVANFLLSPKAQAHAQDPDVLGYGTVLNMNALAPEDRARFDALELGVATLSPADLGPAQPEPHPSWADRLAEEWAKRYGVLD